MIQLTKRYCKRFCFFKSRNGLVYGDYRREESTVHHRRSPAHVRRWSGSHLRPVGNHRDGRVVLGDLAGLNTRHGLLARYSHLAQKRANWRRFRFCSNFSILTDCFMRLLQVSYKKKCYKIQRTIRILNRTINFSAKIIQISERLIFI